MRKFVAIALALCMAGCTAQATEDWPPSPLQTTTYKRRVGNDTYYDVKYYDATTGHTWWVVDVNNTDCVVLDTAGTEPIG